MPLAYIRQTEKVAISLAYLKYKNSEEKIKIVVADCFQKYIFFIKAYILCKEKSIRIFI